jgi:hypothetical protein
MAARQPFALCVAGETAGIPHWHAQRRLPIARGRPRGSGQTIAAMIEQHRPSPPPGPAAGDRESARRPPIGSREVWGYAVWLSIGLVFGIPESWAGIADPPWPTLSNVIWHLETLWSPVAVIVVFLMVFVIFRVARHPAALPGPPPPREDGTGPARTAMGRVTRNGRRGIRQVSLAAYFPAALGIITAACLITVSMTGSLWVLGYVIYGLFAIFCVLIPYVLAFCFASEVPFPTLAVTVANLERRWHPATMIIVAGLVVLMFHLVFAPWPDIFSHLRISQP